MTTTPWTMSSTIRLDARGLARSVTVPQVLKAFGVRVRNSKRADCPLCKGHSTGTLAFTYRLWRCHRCNEGGDVFSLVRAVNRCDFPEALRFVANLAGIRLEDRGRADFQRELDERKRQRERIEAGANKLSALEHALLREYRDRIHKTERTLLKVNERLADLSCGEPERFRGEQERLWLTLQVAAALLSRDLPSYTLLSFGALDERFRFVLHPELRDEIIAGVRWAGYVRTADGKQMEVLT
jgi:CHC2 zinc finger